jgi:hypothetical protein
MTGIMSVSRFNRYDLYVHSGVSVLLGTNADLCQKWFPLMDYTLKGFAILKSLPISLPLVQVGDCW